MTKYEIYECDRCGKQMRLRPNSKPHQINDVKGEASYDLCEDCYASFSYFMMYNKEFDALAEELCKKEEQEELAETEEEE